MKPNEIPTVIAEIETRFPKLLGDLGHTNLEVLLAAASVQEIPSGRALYRDRMPVEYLYFILAGTLHVSVELSGKSMSLGTVHPGEWVGELSVLSGELLASATVVAETPCWVLKLHHLSFEKLIGENDAIAQVLLEQLIELMAKRLRAPHAAPSK